MTSMVSPQAYLEYLRKLARTSHDAWWLVSERTGTEESRRAKLRATLRFFGQEHQAAALESRLDKELPASDLSPDLRDVVEQTVRDLEDYLLPDELPDFRRTVFGLLPLSGADAFCTDRTLERVRLDGYLVILNEGIFVCAQLLAKAFLLANLDGDLLQYRRSGTDVHHAAISHLLAPASAHANRIFFDAVPPDIEGALAAAQMNMTILLLQFVLLHEMGHVVHGDHSLMGEYRFHIAAASEPSPSPTEKFWAAEHSADEYALDRILRRAGADTSRWANFVAIYVFFHWLDAAERVAKHQLCPLHPPPLARGEALRKLMLERVPLDGQTKQLVDKSFDILGTWGASVVQGESAP